MAKIVLGMASSHGPQLAMPPEQWRAYGDRSRTQNAHWYQGKTYTFEELVDMRAESHFDQECTEEKFKARFDACQKAIGHLGDTVSKKGPDVCIIFGDDQHEAFDDGNMPSIAVYHGATIDDVPDGAGGNRNPELNKSPKERIAYPTDAELGQYLVESLSRSEFDVTRLNKLAEDKHQGAVGHAFYYIYRRLMDLKPMPSVPIMVNTYYPPNQPTAMRCYKLGQSIREAVEAWDTDKTVAIFASGGLSHTVIEEDLDYAILDGLKSNDVKKLTDYPDERFRAGTSEIKNWIALAGAMSGTSLDPKVVDYVPCYRTEAGNGCAMGMMEWV
jgi:hypothetical protein